MRALYITNKSDSEKSYAALIASGKKTWEIRKHKTKVRGRFCIVDGSGNLLGTAELSEVLGPFTAKEITNRKEHCSSIKRLSRYSQGKKCLYVWVLKNSKRFKKPKKVTPRFKNQYDWIKI